MNDESLAAGCGNRVNEIKQFRVAVVVIDANAMFHRDR